MHTDDEQQLKDHAALIKLLDIVMGGSVTTVMLITLAVSIQKELPWTILATMFAHLAINTVISQISSRVKYSLVVEIIRNHVIGSAMAFMLMVVMEPVFGQFWFLFFVHNIGGSVVLYFATRRRRWSYLQTVFLIAVLVFANSHLQQPATGPQLAMISTVLFMTAALFAEIGAILHSFARRASEVQSRMVQSSHLSSLGEMAGGIAHEINNPLLVITSAADTLGAVMVAKSIDRKIATKLVDNIARVSHRISIIVKGLKDFARDTSTDPIEEIDVQEVISSAVELSSSRISKQHIDLRVHKDPAGKGLCAGRSIALSQVLINLLNNAIHAIEDLNEKWIEISAHSLDDKVEIRVTDSGGGIPPEIRTKVFEPFYTTKELGRGTGIGLSISLGLIQRDGGNLFIDEDCPNTRFVIQMRRVRPSVEAR